MTKRKGPTPRGGARARATEQRARRDQMHADQEHFKVRTGNLDSDGNLACPHCGHPVDYLDSSELPDVVAGHGGAMLPLPPGADHDVPAWYCHGCHQGGLLQNV